MQKKIVFIDMDNVLVDFSSALQLQSKETLQMYEGRYDEIPHLFGKMLPMPHALESYRRIAAKYDTYILSTAPWLNPSAWYDKVMWVQRYLNDLAYKRLILTHHKNLCAGDYLIDDRRHNGAGQFRGELLQFGLAPYATWEDVCTCLAV